MSSKRVIDSRYNSERKYKRPGIGRPDQGSWHNFGEKFEDLEVIRRIFNIELKLVHLKNM